MNTYESFTVKQFYDSLRLDQNLVFFLSTKSISNWIFYKFQKFSLTTFVSNNYLNNYDNFILKNNKNIVFRPYVCLSLPVCPQFSPSVLFRPALIPCELPKMSDVNPIVPVRSSDRRFHVPVRGQPAATAVLHQNELRGFRCSLLGGACGLPSGWETYLAWNRRSNLTTSVWHHPEEMKLFIVRYHSTSEPVALAPGESVPRTPASSTSRRNDTQ